MLSLILRQSSMNPFLYLFQYPRGGMGMFLLWQYLAIALSDTLYLNFNLETGVFHTSIISVSLLGYFPLVTCPIAS